jgi:RHS repeat-associated protein
MAWSLFAAWPASADFPHSHPAMGDGLRRLVGVVERDNGTNGFNWSAIYDASGRRLRTINVPVVNNMTNQVATLTVDSYYNPQVKYSEVAVGVNGQRTWKVLGPDINGQYGGMHGVGGLEATVQEIDGTIVPVVNDYFGNVLATISSSSATWSPIRVGAYGPVMGYRPATVAPGTALADTLVWRSRWMDPSGFYCLGARYYDPVAGHFLSPDPLGHAASMDLYSFCNGDPLNRFDPTGCFGADAINENQAQIDALTDQYYAENGYGYSPNGDQMYSSFLNSLPLLGAVKGFIELETGNDLVTGQWLQGNGSAQGLTIALSTLMVAMPAAEAGMEAMEIDALAGDVGTGAGAGVGEAGAGAEVGEAGAGVGAGMAAGDVGAGTGGVQGAGQGGAVPAAEETASAELGTPPVNNLPSSGRIFYGTPPNLGGQVIVGPANYQAVTAQNGNGLVLLPQGQALGNNSSIIRYGDPNAQNPNG